MYKIFFFALSFIWLVSTAAFSEKKSEKELGSYLFNKRYLMAVMPFEDRTKDKRHPEIGKIIADQLTNDLFPYKRQRLIERIKIDSILKEANFQQSDYFKEGVIEKIGNQLGAELAVVGSVIDISEKKKKKSIGIASIEDTVLLLTLEARVVLIKTGEILVISKWSGNERSRRKRALIATTDDAKSWDELLTGLIDEGSKEMAYEISREIPENNTN
ncbi:MAG: CsgG/HfaB family protein [Candidatus Theseobacter exili]|nr:CsgG/HfaB family protein [Candidatus Theseobacter exili]